VPERIAAMVFETAGTGNPYGMGFTTTGTV
jgi:hypothetical protein